MTSRRILIAFIAVAALVGIVFGVIGLRNNASNREAALDSTFANAVTDIQGPGAYSDATNAAAEPSVDWGAYAPDLKSRIDGSDCAGLQNEFNQADANGSSSNGYNTDLMVYIDAKLQAKGCYSS